MKDIGLIILGVILSGIAYLIKRKIEGRSNSEKLDNHKKLLDIHKQMDEQGLDIDDLRSLEKILTGKEEAIQNHTVLLHAESKSLVSNDDTDIVTQMELNLRASANYEKAQTNLQNIIAEIDSRVDDKRSQSLLSGQNEWVSYSISQAKAASALYEGGSMYPLVYLSELESLTNERTARLQAEYDVLLQL